MARRLREDSVRTLYYRFVLNGMIMRQSRTLSFGSDGENQLGIEWLFKVTWFGKTALKLALSDDISPLMSTV